MYFSIGRRKGKLWLIKHKKYISKAKKVNVKIEKYPILIFISYRFLYGLRTVTPILIGLSKTKSSKFIFYCILSTVLWALVYSVPGYYFGELLKSKIEAFEQIERYIFLLIAFLLSVIFIQKKFFQNKMVRHEEAK